MNDHDTLDTSVLIVRKALHTLQYHTIFYN